MLNLRYHSENKLNCQVNFVALNDYNKDMYLCLQEDNRQNKQSYRLYRCNRSFEPYTPLPMSIVGSIEVPSNISIAKNFFKINA